jgi:predicted RNase H-like nuclease (RuvC/YqgF family)
VSSIKTALERFQAYCDAKGIPEKSSLAHIHKIGQFEEHERKELRAAYEALQKENFLLDLQLTGFKQVVDSHIESQEHYLQTTALNRKFLNENAALQKENAELRKQSRRYENLRKLNAQQFAELYKLNIQDGIGFDYLVDGLFSKNGE